MIVQAQRSRGGCLTAFLGLNFVFNPLISFYYLSLLVVGNTVPDMPNWAIPVLIIVGFVNMVCTVAIWIWKRWGVYGFGVTSTVVFVVSLISFGIEQALEEWLGLLWLVLLVELVRPVWDQME